MGWQINLEVFMRKVIIIVLTIFFFSGCNDMSNNSSEVNKNTADGNTQEAIDDSDGISSLDVVDSSDSSIDVCESVNAEDFLYQEVKELEPLESYIYQESQKEAYIIIESDVTLHVINFEGTEDEYYMVYVGERYEYHDVNWCWFYVSKDLDIVLYYDAVEDEVYSLSEWRETEMYREQFAFINE